MDHVLSGEGIRAEFIDNKLAQARFGVSIELRRANTTALPCRTNDDNLGVPYRPAQILLPIQTTY